MQILVIIILEVLCIEKEKYEKLLIEYYTENHSFIEKGIFIVTASAITFLLTNVKYPNEGFMLLIFAQPKTTLNLK